MRRPAKGRWLDRRTLIRHGKTSREAGFEVPLGTADWSKSAEKEDPQMSEHSMASSGVHNTHAAAGTNAWVPVVLVGRICFSVVFILSSINHFNGADLPYAMQAGVPMAKVLVPLAGVLALLGGLSVLLGFHAKLGAWLLVLFLLPVTPVMHNFWAVKDPMLHAMQLANFMKNLSMLGAALLITQFGAGPMSFDARRR
jgi:putative oxidoreductase